MAAVEAFGTLKFRTIAPDEIALALAYALRYAQSTKCVEESHDVRKLVYNSLPVLRVEQLALLIAALQSKDSEWVGFRRFLEDYSSKN